jgi:uncharacterized protein (DUF983 family)
MLKKGTKLYSILRMRCPRCHEEPLFESRSAYSWSKMATMPKHCSHCGQKYELEPSFYYGAMYVSYGYTVAIFVAVFIITKFVLGWGIWGTVASLSLILLSIGPYLLRLSRSTYINLFVQYDPHFAKKRKGDTSEGSSEPSNK